jgi:hypothetical protein
LLVSEAVTPMPGLVYSLMTSLAVYAFLGSVVVVLLYRHVVSVPIGAHEGSATAPASGFTALTKAAKVPAE